MRSVLRRLLWLGPTLVVITLVTFGVLSLTLPVDPETAELPLFFNPDPGKAERLARDALRAVAEAGEDEAEAARTLGRLGGAALPFVLPALDSLSPDGRGRVVRALRPVGARMGLEIDEHWEPSREVLFWTRFWDEHSIDYRPTVARRAVLRLAQRSTGLRDAEVRQLDTYALDEIIAQMSAVDAHTDIERVRRLALLAAEVTGQAELTLAAEASAADAEHVASRWGDWWARARGSYKTYTGTERITAMLRDTRYGGWVAQAVRQKLGLLRSGRPALTALRDGARVTLPLLFFGVVGAWGGAVAGGAAASLSARRWARVFGAMGLLRAALPVALLAVMLSVWGGPGVHRVWVGGVLMVLGGAPLLSLYRAATADATSRDFIRTLESLGVSRWRAGVSTARLSSASIVAQLGAHMSSLVTLTFVVEYALGLPGLGAITIEALRRPDLNWLMAITISTSLFVGLLQAMSELLLGVLDPRWQDAASAIGGDV